MKKSDIVANIVWSRDPNDGKDSGRMYILRGLRRAASEVSHVNDVVRKNVFQEFGFLKGMGVFSANFLFRLMTFRPIPLQCAIFAHNERSEYSKSMSGNCIFVIEGIRNYLHMEQLRRTHPNCQIVLEMDDLMSRRAELIYSNKMETSAGAFGKSLPKFIQKVIQSKFAMRTLLRYEIYSLRRIEKNATTIANHIVMVSNVEKSLLESSRATGARSEVHAIAPPAVSADSAIKFFDPDSSQKPIRFVFIGSDQQIQNRTSIDYLIQMWRDYQPDSSLVIFGKQTRTYEEIPKNVIIHGFVDSMSDVYDGRSILLSPTFLAGGVKTKMLEAFCYGAPVIGTELTYEGIDHSEAFLKIDDFNVAELLNRPESYKSILLHSATSGKSLIDENYSEIVFNKKWRNIIQKSISSISH